MRTGSIVATLAMGAVLGTAPPAYAQSAAVLQVSATVPALCQNHRPVDGSRTTACNTTEALVAPKGSTAIGEPYPAAADGSAPTVIYSADGQTRTVVY